MRAVAAGVVYFLLMFGVGWILGPIRELWAVSHSAKNLHTSRHSLEIVAIEHATGTGR